MTNTGFCSWRAHSLVTERKCTHVKRSWFRASERHRPGEGPGGSEGPWSDLGSEPGWRKMQGRWCGGEAPALRPPPHPAGLTAHHSEPTGTHCQGAESPACPYMLAQRTQTPEHVQKRCQHLREEKEARGHSQAMAPTPAQRHLPVSPTRQQSVASGRRQALWTDRAASALTTPLAPGILLPWGTVPSAGRPAVQPQDTGQAGG